MSSESESGTLLESPPLFNYLRQEIPLEDIRDYASPKCIKSIDFTKGFAIIFIIMFILFSLLYMLDNLTL
ncbi:MAG: hypothetical protein ACFFAN_20340 [Promethearchaeota archaeon]